MKVSVKTTAITIGLLMMAMIHALLPHGLGANDKGTAKPAGKGSALWGGVDRWQ